MKKVILKPNAQTKLVKLKTRWQEALKDEIYSDSIPVSPVGEVNQSRVGVRTAIGNLRWLFLLPFLIGTSLALYAGVNGFFISWKKQELSHINYIEASRKKYGQDHFQTTNDKIDIKTYKRLVNEKHMPLKSYLDIRYRDSVGAELALKADIIFGSAAVFTIIVLLVSILSFHRKAPLYFDRERRLIYSWRKGKAWAQYYDEQWFYENTVAMTFILYRLHKKQGLQMRRFTVMPSGNPFINGETLYRPVLAFVHQFMENGREAVFHKDWEGRQGKYLFNDNKPKDFDQQLDKILSLIDAEKINQQVDQLAGEWGYPAQ